MWYLRMTPKSTKYLYFFYSVFGCFVMSFFYNVNKNVDRFYYKT